LALDRAALTAIPTAIDLIDLPIPYQSPHISSRGSGPSGTVTFHSINNMDFDKARASGGILAYITRLSHAHLKTICQQEKIKGRSKLITRTEMIRALATHYDVMQDEDDDPISDVPIGIFGAPRRTFKFSDPQPVAPPVHVPAAGTAVFGPLAAPVIGDISAIFDVPIEIFGHDWDEL